MKIVRLILLILHLGIFILLSGMLLNAYIPPKVFPWLNFLSLAFPGLMFGYVVLTLFWIFSWKKRAFVFLFLGLLFFNSTMKWINYSATKNETPDLKVMSFNTRSGLVRGRSEIREYLKNSGADIILLQEDGSKEYESLGYQTLSPKDDLAILSKYKIVNSEIITLNGNKFISAPAIQVDIEIKGKIYRFINVYLHPFKFERSMIKLDGSNEQDEKRVKNIIKRMIPTFKVHQHQVNAIRKAIQNSPYPVILAGDFNSVPNSYEYYHLLDGLQDAFVESGKGSATSFHDYKFPIRIDYIFTSKSIKPLSYKVDRSVKISDHFPVIATFKLEK